MSDKDLQITEEDIIDVNESFEVAEEATNLTYFGTDFDVDGLVRRLNAGDILVPNFDPPADIQSDLRGFQRRFVWAKPQMDRFIESLLIGYPVPGIFLVQEKNHVLLVLDGQQRLKTLQKFYANDFRGRPYLLENVEKRFRGLTYNTLDADDRRKLDNTFIHATVVKYNPESEQEQDSVYQVFERLNSGGINLQPQEIRVALYSGPFVEIIRSLNEYPAWRELYGKHSERLKDQELILRFFALLENRSNYSRPLKSFLNRYLEKNRNITPGAFAERIELFQKACDTVLTCLSAKAYKLGGGQVNAAVFDSITIGIALRLQQIEKIQNAATLTANYHELMQNKEYLASVSKSTADEENVRTRLKLAEKAFSNAK